MNAEIGNAIEVVANCTDKFLWAAYQAAVKGNTARPTPRLVFASYANGTTRVSEQEARFFFARAMEDSPFRYSVETPTQKLYRQSGSTPRRASFDLTVHDDPGAHLLHCEFKCGGVSPERKDSQHITKDLEKLVRDLGDGLWFHLLKSVNNSTIKHLLETIDRDLEKITTKFARDVKQKSLILHLCVLEHQFSLHKTLTVAPSACTRANLAKDLAVAYDVGRHSVRSLDHNNGWRVHRIRLMEHV